MNMLKCLVVEDEPLAADVLQDYIEQVPFLSLAGRCANALTALELLNTIEIDIIFLDIHLPGLKGLDFLRTIKNPPNVIITTAYHEYAIEGYELNVIDYLLKPIEFNRFLTAVNKVKLLDTPSPRHTTITIHSDKKNVVIPIDTILFIESQKEYIKIQTTTGHHVTKYSLSKIEEELDRKLFFRIHRSFIIALNKVKAYNSNEIDVAGKLIPIGGNFKDTVSQKLANYFDSK